MKERKESEGPTSTAVGLADETGLVMGYLRLRVTEGHFQPLPLLRKNGQF